MRKKLVYIAGPFRSENPWEVEQNVRRAEAAALEVWRLGAAVICPHMNAGRLRGAARETLFLDGDLEMVRRSDALLMVDGWERSAGAMAERRVAEQEDLAVFEVLDELAAWLLAEAEVVTA